MQTAPKGRLRWRPVRGLSVLTAAASASALVGCAQISEEFSPPPVNPILADRLLRRVHLRASPVAADVPGRSAQTNQCPKRWRLQNRGDGRNQASARARGVAR